MFVLDMKTGEVLHGPEGTGSEGYNASVSPRQETPLPALQPIGQKASPRKDRYGLPEGWLAGTLLDTLSD